VSTLTLTIIALDRFVVLIYPFRTRMHVKSCVLLIALIDAAALLFTAPYGEKIKPSSLTRVSRKKVF
jgi:neuropeptide Y receptor